MAETKKVGELYEGATILLEEAGGVYADYTLVQLNYSYNSGKAVLLRNNTIGRTRWKASYNNSADIVYPESDIDIYVNDTWYPSLPASTRECLTPLYYRISIDNAGSSALMISRNAAIPSAAELGYNYSPAIWGSSFSYIYKPSDIGYWTREHDTNSDSIFAIPADGSYFTLISANGNWGARPIVGVDQEKILATWDEQLGGYKLSIGGQAPQSLYLGGAERDLYNAHPDRQYLLSWPAATGRTVDHYKVYMTCSDGTYQFMDNIKNTSVVVSSPSKGYQTNRFILYTLFTGDNVYTTSPATRSISTKNSNVQVYCQTEYESSPTWHLADIQHYDDVNGWTSANGLNYYDENGKWHMAGQD